MNEPQKPKRPTHGAYTIRDSKNGDGFWTKIGSAWPHKDGLGFNIQLETVPFDRQITLRVSPAKTA